MKKALFLAAALSAVGGGAALAQHHDYVAELDTDHDNAISRAEYDAMQTDHFNRQDLNHDGQLSADEPHFGPPLTREQYAAQAFTVYDRADANSDGALVGAEVDALRAIIAPPSPSAHQH